MKRTKYFMAMMGLSAVLALGPSAHTAAAQTDTPAAQEGAEAAAGQQSGPAQDASGAGDLFQKSGEMLGGIDGNSVRYQIRRTLSQMDEMGISPSAIAENLFGIQTDPAKAVETFESQIVKEAQKEVTKRSEGFMSTLWQGFLDTLGSMFTTVTSLLDLDGKLPL